MNVIIVTRDISFGGAGQVIVNKINKFCLDKSVKKILVISPEKINRLSNKLSFKTFDLPKGLFFIKERKYSLEANKILREELRKDNWDLIVCNNPFLNFNPKTFNPKVKVISIFHGLHLSFYKNLPKKYLLSNIARILHKLNSQIDQKQIIYSDKNYFVSRKTMEEAKEFYPEFKRKFYYQPNEVDKSKFFKLPEKEKRRLKKELGFNDGKKNILFIGRLDPMKGILLLTQALEETNNPNIRLIVIGDGHLREKIKRYSFVRYLGKIPNEQLSKYYNIADLFILPSYYENCPMTILEAKACGCKILASDVGDNCFILDKKDLINNCDVEGLKKAILKWLK